MTLIGRDGRYDLVLDGRAGDPPLLRGLRSPMSSAYSPLSPRSRPKTAPLSSIASFARRSDEPL